MKKSLLVISAFFVITSVNTENAFGMKLVLNLFKRDKPSQSELTPQPVTQPTQAIQAPAPQQSLNDDDLRPSDRQRRKIDSDTAAIADLDQLLPVPAPAPAPVAVRQDEPGMVPPVEKHSHVIMQDTPEAIADSATGNQIPMKLDSTASQEVSILRQLNLSDRSRTDAQLIITITPEQLHELIQYFQRMDHGIVDLHDGQVGIIESQKRQEISHTHFQDMLRTHGDALERQNRTMQELQATTVQNGQHITRLGEATNQNNILIVAIQGDVNAIRDNVTAVDGNVTAVRGDVNAIRGTVTETQGQIQRLNQQVQAILQERAHRPPMLIIVAGGVVVFACVLLSGGFSASIPLLGRITGPVLGTTLTGLGTAGWHMLYTRVCMPASENGIIRLLINIITRRLTPAAPAPAIMPVVEPEAVAIDPAPVVVAPAIAAPIVPARVAERANRHCCIQ